MSTRSLLAIIILFFGAFAGLMFTATQNSSALVLTPAQLSEHGDVNRVRVGGVVSALPIKYELQPALELRFVLEEAGRPEIKIPVVYRGVRPDMFAPGGNVLIDGDFTGGTLAASKLMTQCPSKYEPPVPNAQAQDAR